MAMIIKCKMCGGDIEATADMTIGQCRYCGSTMTLPRIESDKKARLFNRANDYRLNNDFDKAYDAYKTITEEDEQEAEAYWGMILSEYGVEYIEDPNTHKRIPTCHRTQMQSILENTNYSLALEHSSGEQKMMYRDEAETLDKLQRQIISVSSRLEPYDVFICYKETDDDTGERTADSLLAESIYDELEKQGVRTFFSRISLEEHLGENYEPYIYAALKSARIMLVVGMTAEHVEAIWVKNEWSRFLHFMDEDDNKVLIPVYKDMSTYDFPNALSKFQMQDMAKVGAINDLVRGVKKILGTTRTEKRDATLDALVADKKEREVKEKKQKTIIGIVAVLAVIIVVIRMVMIFPDLRKNWISKQIEKNSITVSEGVPDSSKYKKLIVEVNGDNFFNYFGTDQAVEFDELKGYEIKSKLYDVGWVYWNSRNCIWVYYDQDRKYSTRSARKRIEKHFSSPFSINMFAKDERPIVRIEKSDKTEPATITFVSKDIVDAIEMKIDEENKVLIRTVKLINGQENTEKIEMPYIEFLEKYLENPF